VEKKIMNEATIAGHLGADPEVRFTSSGQKVITLRVAARCRKNQKNDETIWWRVSIWGEQFDKMIPYFKKGSSIMLIGEINKPEIFTDREGKPQISMSMTAHNLWFSPFGRSSDANGEPSSENSGAFATAGASNSIAYGQSGNGATMKFPSSEKGDSFDDEVPF
jgi:single-strand DNA-binding protein